MLDMFMVTPKFHVQIFTILLPLARLEASSDSRSMPRLSPMDYRKLSNTVYVVKL